MKSFVRLGLLSLSISLAACSGSNKSNDAPTPAVTVKTSSAEISLDTQLLNAIHNFDNLSIDDRLAKAAELIEAGANVNGTNEFGEPLLADAVHFGDGSFDDFRLVKLLVGMGADVNAVGPTGRSPLTKAAEVNQIDEIEYFLEHGLEVNNENGTRALVKAAFFGNKKVAELLLARGLKPSGRYANALMSMNSEETYSASQLFGAYVDLAKEELMGLLPGNATRVTDNFLVKQLSRIEQSCKQINSSEAFDGNMSQFFQSKEECSVMGRLGSLAYMQCYGLLHSNSANLTMLQENITVAATQARAVLQFENVKFADLKNSRELAGYYQMVRASMEMYQDLILPWMRVVSGKMGHHLHRNGELQSMAKQCGNRAIYQGATELAGSENAIAGNQAQQLSGFKAELAALDKMREKISYQLPTLSATEELKRREEIRRKEEEARKKKEEEDRKKKEEEKNNPPVKS